MDLKLLREATRPDHEATETAVPLTGPGLTREKYVRILQQFYGVICAWDSVAAAEAPTELAALVRERRRCASLEADLRFFHAEAGPAPPAALLQQIRDLIHKGADERAGQHGSRFLGAMYVLEGSTLGGQYIAHQVESELHLERGEGDRFFRGYGSDTMPKWREFQQALSTVPDAEGPHVIAAAKAMFGIFQEWMGRMETPLSSSPLAKR